MTPWREFCNTYGRGCGSPLCDFILGRRGRIVLARGTVPCEVLFIGEAPGESEDLLGRPFVGPAGKKLDHILDSSIGALNRDLASRGLSVIRYALTNLTGCIPRGDDGRKSGEPSAEEIVACQRRLEDFVKVCDDPLETLRLIVCVGTLAQKWTDPKMGRSARFHRPIPWVEIVHPSAILRANIAMKGLMVQRAIVTIANAVEDVAERMEKERGERCPR